MVLLNSHQVALKSWSGLKTIFLKLCIIFFWNMGCTILYNRPWQYIYIYMYIFNISTCFSLVCSTFLEDLCLCFIRFFGRSPPICQGGGEGAIHEPQGPADVRSRFRMSTGGELSHEQNITYLGKL